MSINIEDLLGNPSTSYWLKEALTSALKRDIVDAARDAELLSETLRIRANEALGIRQDERGFADHSLN